MENPALISLWHVDPLKALLKDCLKGRRGLGLLEPLLWQVLHPKIQRIKANLKVVKLKEVL